jgi:hypothetical protein
LLIGGESAPGRSSMLAMCDLKVMRFSCGELKKLVDADEQVKIRN